MDIGTSFVFLGSAGFHKKVTIEDVETSPMPSSVASPMPSLHLDPGVPRGPQCPQCLLECPRCPPCPRCCPAATKDVASASASADPVEQVPTYAIPADEHVYDIPHTGISPSCDSIADLDQGTGHRYDEPYSPRAFDQSVL